MYVTPDKLISQLFDISLREYFYIKRTPGHIFKVQHTRSQPKSSTEIQCHWIQEKVNTN